MPKRRVRQVSWEVESERMLVTPAMERRIRKGVLQRAKQDLSELTDATTDEEAFYALPRAATAAYYLERFEEAEGLARRSIMLAEQFKDSWHYGNAVHAGYTVLGLLALRSQRTPQAVEALFASGNVGGSPQLASFGPSMQLARELLKAGEPESVLAYLDQCRAFWKSGGLWLSIWERKIRRGATPNFIMNLYR